MDWTNVVGAVGGAIGAIGGTVGAVLGTLSYRLSKKQQRVIDARFQQKTREHEMAVTQHQRDDREAEVTRVMEEIELRYKGQYRDDRKSGKKTGAAIRMEEPTDKLQELAYHHLEKEGKIIEQKGEYFFKIHPEYWKI